MLLPGLLAGHGAFAQPAEPEPLVPTAARSAEVAELADDGEGPAARVGAGAPLFQVELKRQNTSRGTVDESTRTTLRLQSLMDGPVRLFRIDLPFPDAKTGFSGDPFNPRPGDLKLRLGFRPLQQGVYRFPTFIELTLPTADPESLGSGKFQLSAGLRMLAPLKLPFAQPAEHLSRFEVELQQVNSFRGDPARSKIDYTKLELSAFDLWRRTWSWKVKLKPSVDWVKNGQSGGVGELEGGWIIDRAWRTTLMFGRRLWGPSGIGGTYDDRFELTLSRLFQPP